ncbi:serpin-ZXA [Ziziphus jujuba]|uniref:Serpin-ZXA n=2 Tax=Ziziphus jujuba TaxID=326968 RepID=A0A6P4AG03_ZIZJJ|nr:serpin-ZXA [Ziziphus jujuba]KAH7516729.1 hypothetical protein FEM48_Zijuj10G0165800 [Ziziphus jujuba var. spinosa]
MEFCMNVATEGILEALMTNPNENVVVSPSSLNVVLNMVASGSNGKTLGQFFRFLGAKNFTDLNSHSSSLMALLNGSTKTTTAKNAPLLSMVNVMFVDQQYSSQLKPSFQEIVREIYKTEPTSVDFHEAEKLKNEVNSWAEKNTNGLIKDFLSPPTQLFPPFFLANALYFKATWKDQFDAALTRDKNFHLLDGKTIEVPFMVQKQRMTQSYGSFKDFKVIRLYYNQGDDYRYMHERMCMDIILPHKKDGLQDLLHKFNSYDAKNLLHNFDLQPMEFSKIWIPKWKFSYGLDPTDLMKKLGLTLPFHYPVADFTNMMDSPSGDEIFIKSMLQKSFIEVNEEGTEAAAVTAVFGCFGSSPCSPPRVEFVADHPFMFMIREEVSGAVIFTGAVLNPLSE